MGGLCKFKPIIMRAVEGKALVGYHFSVWQRSFVRFAGNTGWAKSPCLESAHLPITLRSRPRLGYGDLGRKACCIDEAIFNQLSAEKYESSDVDIHVVLQNCLCIEGRDGDENNQIITRLGMAVMEKVRDNAPENLKVPRYLGKVGRQRQHIWMHPFACPSSHPGVDLSPPSCSNLASRTNATAGQCQCDLRYPVSVLKLYLELPVSQYPVGQTNRSVFVSPFKRLKRSFQQSFLTGLFLRLPRQRLHLALLEAPNLHLRHRPSTIKEDILYFSFGTK